MRDVCAPFREIELILAGPLSIWEKLNHGFQLIWGYNEKHQLKREGSEPITPLFEARAQLNQQWAQGLMCIRAPIRNRPKKLKIFDKLKYIMWT